MRPNPQLPDHVYTLFFIRVGVNWVEAQYA